jgi:hypothetical protein
LVLAAGHLLAVDLLLLRYRRDLFTKAAVHHRNAFRSHPYDDYDPRREAMRPYFKATQKKFEFAAFCPWLPVWPDDPWDYPTKD